MDHVHTRLWLALSLLIALAAPTAGCREPKLSDGFPCSTNGKCPSPFQCVGGLCVRSPGTDGPVGGNGGGPGTDGGGMGGSEGGVVVPPGSVVNGQPCSVNGDCMSTVCKDGVCCATACNGACQ